MKLSPFWRERQLLAATLLLSNLLPLAAPAWADGTAAGTTISNTATASYADPNDPTVVITTTSNKVDITVAEVAGVTVTPLATIDTNGGTVLPNDTVNYDFKVTNVGNDTTEFFIPGTSTVTGPGTAQPTKIVGYVLPDGTVQRFTPANEVLVPPAGATTGTLTTLPAIGTNPPGVIPAGYSLIVEVPVQVTALASSGAPLSVQLGNTGPNDNGTTTQNQPDITDTPLANEVRTVDSSTEISVGAPSNGEREASSVQQVLVGSTPQAFATILKTRSSYTDSNTPATLNDDVLTYGLAMRVESTAPVGSTGLSPAGLVGMNVNGIGANRVLISDAIPTGTTLNGTATSPDPAKWVPVYTADALSVPSTAATWSTTLPAGAVTRVGFVYDTTSAAIPAGTTFTGFSFKVTTTGITTATTIANIAQLFGQTNGNAGPNAPLVYDESGDQLPTNYNDNGTPGNPATLTPSSPPNTIPTGVPNQTNDGVDSNNDNTGSGPGGEDNVFTIAAPGTVLNGPNAAPGAVGPINNNDDFTNKSAAIAPSVLPGALINPPPVTFNNSISNPSSAALTDILLVPDAANFVAATGETLPPQGTKVTLSYGGQTAVYNFDGTNFVFQSGALIKIPTLAPGATVNYAVAVDLPGSGDPDTAAGFLGTPLSTDTLKGFSVPVYAFKDVDSDGRPDAIATEPTQNRTIDRVYTGFVKLLKDARILDKDGTTVLQDYPTTPGTTVIAPALVQPGRIVEYRIQYQNISIAPAGAGNVILNATKVMITEDGVLAPNNWAKDNDINGKIDTSNVMGAATATYGTITYFPSGDQTGTTATTDVTKYLNDVGVIIQPNATGQFTFRRKVAN